jgi:hypothetical protein
VVLSCLSAKKRWWETTGFCVRLDSVRPFFLSYTIIHNHLIYQYTLAYGMEYIIVIGGNRAETGGQDI